ncbi:MAG: bifunctional DNA-formamidopyrimidine glycosylase/DNA-(apurinic or apyrimidinic site) lyase [Patescibacteria group bacterium]|jgi:formamidopyrimidine-DNA glycosylase
MPELPEVLTIAQTLDKNIRDFRIEKVTVDSIFRVSPVVEDFQKALIGRSINKISNYAKNIVFELDDKRYLVVHLAMTGQLMFRKLESKPFRWERVLLTLSKSGKTLNLAYNDMRMFGKMEIKDQSGYKELEQKYGLNPLDENVTSSAFHIQLKKKNSIIKNVLLDQKIIAGAGNIYVNDALFMAGILPKRKTTSLSEKESGALLKGLREILREGIEHRGSTLDDEMFVDPFGKKGSHQNYFRIYGKKTCPNCQSNVVFEQVNGRGTYYCTVCQK